MSLRMLDEKEAVTIAASVINFLDAEVERVLSNPTKEEKEMALKLMMTGLMVAFQEALK